MLTCFDSKRLHQRIWATLLRTAQKRSEIEKIYINSLEKWRDEGKWNAIERDGVKRKMSLICTVSHCNDRILWEYGFLSPIYTVMAEIPKRSRNCVLGG